MDRTNLKRVAQWIVRTIILNVTIKSVCTNHLCVMEKMIVGMEVMNQLSMLVVHPMLFVNQDSGLAQDFQTFVSINEKFVMMNQIARMVRMKARCVTMQTVTIIGDNAPMVVFKPRSEHFARVLVVKF